MTEPAAPQPLDPLALPLAGSRLIEASAGTGKTWTIAALFLRLVLGHGRSAALAPGQILVMTFTRAATRELADRIRARLVEAAAVFRQSGDAPAPDPFLAGLLAAYPAGEAREAAAWRLASAAEAMDDAAVVTIDAWCQRMLREHAFDSGCLFDEELQADESALLAEAARDYWRQQVLPLAGEALDLVLARWPDADALAADVGRWLAWLPAADAAPDAHLPAVLAAALTDRAQTLAALKAGWAERAEALRGWLDAQLARKKPAVFNGQKLHARYYGPWLDTVRDWADDPALTTLCLSPSARNRLSTAGLQEALAKDAIAPPWPPEIDALQALLAALDALAPPSELLRPHAAAHLARRVAELKAQTRSFGFSDMLQRLDDALDPARHGARAERLRAQIVGQFPVALVDEFQDTSPTQLSIFDRLYRLDDTPPELTLLLIGDPKQAIYGFRGADIHSYLRARRATAGRHHVLGVNHRSTTALVGAVNAVFERAEQRPGDSAFLYRPQPPMDTDAHAVLPADEPEDEDRLPFVPVAARGRPEQLQHAGQPVPALQFTTLDAAVGSTEGRALFAALAAEQVVRWLNDPHTGFAAPNMPWRRLRPADIAVLVRSRTEAQAIQRALLARRVPSVYLSDKDSVFAGDEAPDLLRLLQAIAAPRDGALARTAFATGLVGLPVAQLVALASDEAAFDALAAHLPVWQAVWQAQGVLAALRQALHALALPARWLAQPGGERRLTNVLHLAELLQAESGRLDGEHALLRWFAGRIHDAAEGLGGGEEPVLRLESDADLVQVVTVHKSKGLEYPVVLLPFVALPQQPPPGHTRAPLVRPGPGGQPVLVWHPRVDDLATAAHERLREGLRLLYVALTRARHALWLGVAPSKTGPHAKPAWQTTALGRLVSGPAPVADAEIADHLGALARAAGDGIVVQPAALGEDGRPGRTTLVPREAGEALAPAPRYSASFDRQWAIASYSQLVKDASRSFQPAAGDDGPPVLAWRDDEPGEAADPAVGPQPLPAPWHRFPRGALPGNFLHGQLEWLAGEGFALAEQPGLQQALKRRCEREGWGHRADDVLAWLQRVCATPLPPLGVALSGIAAPQAEMEFWLPIAALRASAVDALCRQHILPGQARPALPERALHGLLMGFADLVFSHGGRHGVLDYKSNALGSRDADYTLPAMQAAVLDHRYDVQAALYLLALHRLLKHRLGARYRPEAQLHGAVFLFLRGIAGPAAGACPIPVPPALLAGLEALLPPAPVLAEQGL